MFFKNRRAAASESVPETSLIDDEIARATRVDHGRYTILVMPRQLHNGNWIVRVALEERLPDGPRRYDFAGPMSEHSSEEDARRAGVENATRRLDNP